VYRIKGFLIVTTVCRPALGPAAAAEISGSAGEGSVSIFAAYGGRMGDLYG